MKRLIIVVVTPDEGLRRTIEIRREQLIPETFKRNRHEMLGGAQVNISCFLGSSQTSQQNLLDHIEPFLAEDTIGVLLLVDRRLEHLAVNLASILFVAGFAADEPIRSPLNFLTSLLNRLLRDFRLLTIRFDNLKYRKLFTLPIRNYVGPELADVLEVCANSINRAGFVEQLDSALSVLADRQRPKRYGDWPDIYIVDHDDKHFSLGKERHSKAETSIPPHSWRCIWSNMFRVGRRFDSELHYNVSRGGEKVMMDGNYPDCHGVQRGGGGGKHLNMFPNDYF